MTPRERAVAIAAATTDESAWDAIVAGWELVFALAEAMDRSHVDNARCLECGAMGLHPDDVGKWPAYHYGGCSIESLLERARRGWP